jgi:putative transposase
MMRAFRYPLRPTKAQEAVLETWRLACCELYNAALEQRRDAGVVAKMRSLHVVSP